MLNPARDVNVATRWLAVAAIAVILFVSLALGYGLGHALATRGHASTPAVVATAVATQSTTGSTDQPASVSRMDLQIHEQDYCECNK